MSRRHHGRPHHRLPAGNDGPRREASVAPIAATGPESLAPRAAVGAPPATPAMSAPPAMSATPAMSGAVDPRLDALPPAPWQAGPAAPADEIRPAPPLNVDRSGQCTAPQLRRFIKSRPYVPMHELRRRFGINGDDDDVTPVRLDPGWIYVGLPPHEGRLLGDLMRSREIGFELSLDPRTPIVIGVYPMRPIPRN